MARPKKTKEAQALLAIAKAGPRRAMPRPAKFKSKKAYDRKRLKNRFPD